MREFWMLFSSGALVFVGIYFGRKFLKLRNYMLGYEWYILALSSSSGAVFAFGHVEAAGTLWHFLDLFSKLLGIPLIAGLGLLKVTHDYEPSKAMDVAVFAISALISVYLFNRPDLAVQTEWAIYAASAAYSVVLLIFVYQYVKFGEWTMAFLMVCMMAINVYVAGFEDFLVLAPDDHMPVRLRDFVFAYLTWSASFAATYLFYVRLARVKGVALPGGRRMAAEASARA